MTDYPIHPACALWPRPSDEEVLRIADSIKAEGLLNPIWLYEGAILDGKIRYEACKIADVEPRFQEYTGDDPLKFSIAQNRERRHIMDAMELTFIVAELCKLQHGGNRGNQYTGGKSLSRHLPRSEEKTIDILANEADLGRSNVVAVKSVLQKGEPNIIAMVRTKKVGAQTAAYFVRQNSEISQQKATVDQVKGARNLREEKQKVKITIPYEDVIGKFRPLIKRVKEQSKRHAATVSFVELSVIAHELEELADAWTENETELGTHSAPVPIHRVRKGG